MKKRKSTSALHPLVLMVDMYKQQQGTNRQPSHIEYLLYDRLPWFAHKMAEYGLDVDMCVIQAGIHPHISHVTPFLALEEGDSMLRYLKEGDTDSKASDRSSALLYASYVASTFLDMIQPEVPFLFIIESDGRTKTNTLDDFSEVYQYHLLNNKNECLTGRNANRFLVTEEVVDRLKKKFFDNIVVLREPGVKKEEQSSWPEWIGEDKICYVDEEKLYLEVIAGFIGIATGRVELKTFLADARKIRGKNNVPEKAIEADIKLLERALVNALEARKRNEGRMGDSTSFMTNFVPEITQAAEPAPIQRIPLVFPSPDDANQAKGWYVRDEERADEYLRDLSARILRPDGMLPEGDGWVYDRERPIPEFKTPTGFETIVAKMSASGWSVDRDPKNNNCLRFQRKQEERK